MITNRIGNLFEADVFDFDAFGSDVDAEPLCLPWDAGSPAIFKRFQPGSRVRIVSGVFEGIRGTFLSYRSSARVVLEVDLDCPGVAIELDDHQVAAIEW